MRRPLCIQLYFAIAILIAGSAVFAEAITTRVSAAQSVCDNSSTSSDPQSAACMVERRVALLREVRDTLRREASVPAQAGVPASDSGEARRYVTWLSAWADRLDALGVRGTNALTKGEQSGGGPQVFQATKQMQEQQLSFNFQYLELSKQMGNEHRRFNLVSNVMKTKHANVEKAINMLIAGR